MHRLRLGSVGEKALNIRVYVDRSPLPARRLNIPEIPSLSVYVNKSRKTHADLFYFYDTFCVLCDFYFDRTERVWFSPRSFKEMKSPNPNKSFDKVIAVIAILALIGFVVGLFKIMA